MTKTLLLIGCAVFIGGCTTTTTTTQPATQAPIIDTATTPTVNRHELPVLPSEVTTQPLPQPQPPSYQPRYIRVVPSHKPQETCKPEPKAKSTTPGPKKLKAKQPVPDLKAKAKLKSKKTAKPSSKKPIKTKTVLKHQHKPKK